jgi:iron complex transport system substrate-binding protein
MRASAAALALLTAAAAAHAAVTIDDDRGRTVRLERPAQRIVVLAPHLAELAFAAGAGDRVVGASTYTDYPEAAKRLPVVGNFGRVDLERLVELAPDLVLAWSSGNPTGEVARIERLGVPVAVGEIRDFSDVPRWLRLIGRLAGTEAASEQSAVEFERELESLRTRFAGRPSVSVFYEIWHAPLMTVNGSHLISRTLAYCGGVNIFAEAATLTPAVSREQLIARQPQAIFVAAPAGQAEQTLDDWRSMKILDAVRADRLYTIDPALTNRMGLRVLEGIRVVCQTLDRARERP